MFFKQKKILMEFKKTKESGIVVKVKKEKRYKCVKCCSYFTGELCDSLRKAFKITTCDSTIFEQIETAYYKQKRF